MIRDAIIVLALLTAAGLAVLLCTISHYCSKYGAAVMLWRFLTGDEWHGHGHHRPWTSDERRQRRRRAARRDTITLAALATGFGLITAPAVTITLAAALAAMGAAAGIWRAVWLIQNWQHQRHYVKPLEYTLTAMLPEPRTIKVTRDGRAVRAVTIEWPAEAEIREQEQKLALEAVTTRLAIEAPDAAWALKGRQRAVTFTHSKPPPARITWDQIAGELGSLQPHELLTGIGKRDTTVTASLEDDSPHYGIISGTGGGKSNLAAFWLLQQLRRGDIALILDAKRFSHPWTFKDMDAEYGQLPNIAYCRTVTALHDAMCWLSEELDRRNSVAERTIDAKGHVHGDPGPRLWIIAEEMNLAHGALKQHWRALCAEQGMKAGKSPAFDGLGAVAFAGRAVKMHLVVIGQMLKAEVLGGGDVRENIGVRALTRYTHNSWKMQAGDIPMPPPPSVTGRWQQLASGVVSEVQVPYVDMEQARDLATGGIVTPIPAGMPGRAIGAPLSVPALPPGQSSPDLHVVVQQSAEPDDLTVKEALTENIFGPLSLEAARRRVQRADLEPAGKRGDGSYTYTRADLFRAARDRRKELVHD